LLGNYGLALACSTGVKRERRKGQTFASTEELQLNYFNIQVEIWAPEKGRGSTPALMWKLIPVKVEPHSPNETGEHGFPPSYEGDETGQPSTRTQRAESERDDFGTIVTEVSTVTTRRRYRVEDA